MATELDQPTPQDVAPSARLQSAARRHLWLHYTRMGGELYRRGLICGTDDRGDPVITLAPLLIAGPPHFSEIEAALREVLTEASRRAGLR